MSREFGAAWDEAVAAAGVGLFTVGMDDSWIFSAGVGWGVVLVVVWLWALRVERA